MKIELKAETFLLAAAFGILMGLAIARADPISTSTQPVAPPSATVQESTPQSSPGFDATLTGDWLGFRQKLADAGATVGATLVLEGFNNFQGGIDTGAVGSTTFDLNLTLDLDKLLKITGGQIYFDLEDHAFRNPSAALIGDIQNFDRLNDPAFLQVNELWYQQTLFNSKLRLKIGKVDANSEFCVIDNGQTFLNDGTQSGPTIFVLPTTPTAMPSINAFLTSTGGYFASFGAYYSNESDRFGDIVDDPALVTRSRYGSFLIGETGVRWNNAPVLNLAGNFKIGGWGHTGTFQKLDGSSQTGIAGGYAIFDQTLYQPPGESQNGRGIRMFAEYDAAESDIYPLDQHTGIGATLTGPAQFRRQDILGLTAEYAQISSQALLRYPYEMAIETFYQIQFTPWMQIQPDLQYVIHPGGRYPDALVGTLRCTIQF
jgi:porin